MLGIMQLVIIRGLGWDHWSVRIRGWRTRLLEVRRPRNKNPSMLGVSSNIKSLSPGMMAGAEANLVQKCSMNERVPEGVIHNSLRLGSRCWSTSKWAKGLNDLPSYTKHSTKGRWCLVLNVWWRNDLENVMLCLTQAQKMWMYSIGSQT